LGGNPWERPGRAAGGNVVEDDQNLFAAVSQVAASSSLNNPVLQLNQLADSLLTSTNVQVEEEKKD